MLPARARLLHGQRQKSQGAEREVSGHEAMHQSGPIKSRCLQFDGRGIELDQRLKEASGTQAQEQTWINAGRLEGRYLRFLRTPNRIDDYQTIKTVGKGAFGEVKVVRRKQDGRVYALKSQLKTQTIAQLQAARVRTERDILVENQSPWVVKLYTTFQDARFLYMLMEFVPGGDLMTMLIKYQIFSEDITRFYMAEMIMAINAVHELGFIHRFVPAHCPASKSHF